MGCLRFTDGERERDDHREAKQKTRVVVVVVVVTLSLFSPSKSFGAVERGGRRQKARDDDVFLLDRIDRVSSPKDALRRKGILLKKSSSSSSSSYHRLCRRGDDAVSRE